jgi:hypothetical protein
MARRLEDVMDAPHVPVPPKERFDRTDNPTDLALAVGFMIGLAGMSLLSSIHLNQKKVFAALSFARIPGIILFVCGLVVIGWWLCCSAGRRIAWAVARTVGKVLLGLLLGLAIMTVVYGFGLLQLYFIMRGGFGQPG